MKFTPASRKESVRRQLTSSPVGDWPETWITLQTPSRKLGHKDNRLEAVLDSFVRMTKHPERCEILVKIDDDDDLNFFNAVKKKFTALNLRFFVTPRGRGYADAHIHHLVLADQGSASSRAWAFFSDDSFFSRSDWDLGIYELIENTPAFVTGSQPVETVMSVIDADTGMPNTIFSYACEPYPVVSRNILDGLRVASEGVPGWTAFGDRFCFDGLLSAIIHLLHEEHGIDVYHQIDQHLSRPLQRLSWSSDRKRPDVRTEAMTHFFSPDAVETRAKVVAGIVESGALGTFVSAAR